MNLSLRHFLQFSLTFFLITFLSIPVYSQSQIEASFEDEALSTEPYVQFAALDEQLQDRDRFRKTQQEQDELRNTILKARSFLDSQEIDKAREELTQAISNISHADIEIFIYQNMIQKNLDDESKKSLVILAKNVVETYKKGVDLFDQGKKKVSGLYFTKVSEKLPDLQVIQAYLLLIEAEKAFEESKITKEMLLEQEKEKEAWRKKIQEKEKAINLVGIDPEKITEGSGKSKDDTDLSKGDDLAKMNKEAEAREIYDQAMEAYKNKKYKESKKLFMEVDKVIPQYRHTRKYIDRSKNQIAKEAERIRRKKMSKLYQDAVDLYKDKNYIDAHQVFVELDEMKEGYRSVENYLREIEEKHPELARKIPEIDKDLGPTPEEIKAREMAILAEKEAIILEAQRKEEEQLRLKELYGGAMKAYEDGLFKESKDLFVEIQEIDPSYKDTRKYIAKVNQKLLAEAQKAQEPKFKPLVDDEIVLEQDIEELYAQGIKYIEDGYFKGAREKFIAVQNINPDYKDTRKYIARIDKRKTDLIALKNEDKSIEEILDENINSDLDVIESIYDSAVELYEKKKYERAKEIFELVRETDSKFRSTRKYIRKIDKILLEQEQMKQKDFIEIEESEYIRRMQIRRKELFEKEAEEKYQLALRNYQNERYNEAKVYFIQVEAVYPDYKKTLDYLEEIDDKIQKNKNNEQLIISSAVPFKTVENDGEFGSSKAEKYIYQMDRAKNDGPISEIRETYKIALNLYRDERYEEAEEVFLKVHQLSPGYRSTRKYLDRIYEKFKIKEQERKLQQERSIIQHVAAVDPQEQIKELSKTSQMKKDAMKEQPDLVEDEKKKPDAKEDLGHSEKSEKAMTGQAKLEEDQRDKDFEDKFDQAISLFKEKQYEKAMSLFEELKRLQPEHSEVSGYIEKTAKALERQEEIKHANELAELFTQAEQIYFSGNLDTAMGHYQDILKKDSTYNPARRRIKQIQDQKEKMISLRIEAEKSAMAYAQQEQEVSQEGKKVSALPDKEGEQKSQELAAQEMKQEEEQKRILEKEKEEEIIENAKIQEMAPASDDEVEHQKSLTPYQADIKKKREMKEAWNKTSEKNYSKAKALEELERDKKEKQYRKFKKQLDQEIAALEASRNLRAERIEAKKNEMVKEMKEEEALKEKAEKQKLRAEQLRLRETERKVWQAELAAKREKEEQEKLELQKMKEAEQARLKEKQEAADELERLNREKEEAERRAQMLAQQAEEQKAKIQQQDQAVEEVKKKTEELVERQKERIDKPKAVAKDISSREDMIVAKEAKVHEKAIELTAEELKAKREADRIRKRQEALRKKRAKDLARYQREIDQMLEKRKKEQADRWRDEARDLYGEALKLYDEEMFLAAKIKFAEVNSFIDGYKSTDVYIKKINRILEAEKERHIRQSVQELKEEEKLKMQEKDKSNRLEAVKDMEESAKADALKKIGEHKRNKELQEQERLAEVKDVTVNQLKEAEKTDLEKIKQEKLAKESAERARLEEEELARQAAERLRLEEARLARVKAQQERERMEEFERKKKEKIKEERRARLKRAKGIMEQVNTLYKEAMELYRYTDKTLANSKLEDINRLLASQDLTPDYIDKMKRKIARKKKAIDKRTRKEHERQEQLLAKEPQQGMQGVKDEEFNASNAETSSQPSPIFEDAETQEELQGLAQKIKRKESKLLKERKRQQEEIQAVKDREAEIAKREEIRQQLKEKRIERREEQEMERMRIAEIKRRQMEALREKRAQEESLQPAIEEREAEHSVIAKEGESPLSERMDQLRQKKQTHIKDMDITQHSDAAGRVIAQKDLSAQDLEGLSKQERLLLEKQRRDKMREIIQQRQEEVKAERAKIQREFKNQIENLYRKAIRLSKEGDYANARNIFMEIERMEPDYKKSKHYIEKLTQRIRRQPQEVPARRMATSSQPRTIVSPQAAQAKPRNRLELISNVLDQYEDNK